MLNIVKEEEKNIIIVPKGIRYISDWEDYNLVDFNFPHILDKKIPGCGYTEYCIRNNMNTILCSPRKILLENKEDQHPGEVFYVKNELEKTTGYDKDITKMSKTKKEEEFFDEDSKEVIENLKTEFNNYILQCNIKRIPIKILVTYDSFRLVKEFLGSGILNFQVVVDEFQSVLVDSRFKSSTEMEFLKALNGLDRVCFVSATPMIDKYLKRIPEFASLPYYELDWFKEDNLRISKPDLKVRIVSSIITKSTDIINTYKSGNFEKFTNISEDGNVEITYSKEVVFYVNSVNNILSIIKKNNLQPEEVNLLCAKTPENIKKVRARLGKDWEIGRVPKKGELHKMFTFCTRTVYLGADFYSINARTIIMSDANIDTLAVDISLDLPQILGRQRLIENPWKNRAEFYYKTITDSNVNDVEEFRAFINNKITNTNNLLMSYDVTPSSSAKNTLAEKYEKDAKNSNYKDDYVSVNKHGGNNIIPAYNNLVQIAEERAFDIQQIDYKDRFAVFNAMTEYGVISGNNIQDFLDDFECCTRFYDKMKKLCELALSESEISFILDQLPLMYKNYYLTVGPERCKAAGYNITDIDREYKDLVMDKSDLESHIYSSFKIGEKYSMSRIKEMLVAIYDKIGYNKVAKSTDLDKYFEIKRNKIVIDGVRENAFEIIKKRE